MVTDTHLDRTFPAVLGFGAGLAVVQGVFDYTGGKFTGFDKDPQIDDYARKEQLRNDKRRPIQETLDQLGEGRGTRQIHTIAAYLERLTGASRHLRTWLQRATSSEDKGGLRNRRASDLRDFLPCI